VLSIAQDAITRDKPQEGSKEPSVKNDNASSEPKGQELVYSARVSLDRTQMQITVTPFFTPALTLSKKT
jgi:hemolysin D